MWQIKPVVIESRFVGEIIPEIPSQVQDGSHDWSPFYKIYPVQHFMEMNPMFVSYSVFIQVLQCVGSHVDNVLHLSHGGVQRNFLLVLTSCEL